MWIRRCLLLTAVKVRSLRMNEQVIKKRNSEEKV